MTIRHYISLVEGANGVLYHGTSILCFVGILQQNVLRDDLGQDDYHSGVSLTRALGIAKKFAADAEEYASYTDDIPPGSLGVVIALNRQSVMNQSALMPVRWDGVSSEQEERTKGPVSNVTDAMMYFHVREEDLAHYQACGVDVDAIAHHPKRKR